MQICRIVSDIRAAVARFRAGGAGVGLVTTMGALHDGHMALVSEARAAHDRVVATIFINPTQFGEAADLANYPRTEAEDLARLEAAGVDAVLIPEAAEIYPEGDETVVETTRLANMLHGAVRPGHFRGVTTVVAKLFNICQPDAAYFGEKDYQQLHVIKRMVRDLHMHVKVRGVPTVRDTDGLALSSRNTRLTPEDRTAAPILSRALDAAQHGGAATAEDLARIIRDRIADEPRATLEGLDIVRLPDFTPATGPLTGPVGIMISAEFGSGDNRVLLIDQREVRP
ncbi:MAG: pantoate--beta-alanine ligase [Salibaculum sp.]|uniref:pantoate--beta-alanine ligase n=1 Tax=Salibaculum sp. TaxID=2855480 RepID=UPI0028708BF9|nr:pantoate--beta-alanine ligase [Salibaculum sp.]MDR9427793.1 pantoate--beta-alanine ligase [Salibaculum sp.]MDR9482010.1 pantoate--beta-alanine ligase [Salibaculum sp.]